MVPVGLFFESKAAELMRDMELWRKKIGLSSKNVGKEDYSSCVLETYVS